jgi:DNA (cytosine-5)-methyltransferase 1
MKLKMIELFAGIGGFRLASDWVGGIETIVSVEINPFCQKVLKKNFPNTPIYDDVTTYKPTSYCDLVVGGSPCQDLSIAGVQKGIIEGKRSSLWFEQLRIYKESRATFLIWENVAGAFRNGFREVLRSLSESGYDAEWQVISAATFGHDHLRERIFLIAYPNGLFGQAPPWSDQIGSQITEIKTNPLRYGLQMAHRQKLQRSKTHRENRRFANVAKRSSVEPPAWGIPYGSADRLDRLAAIGNAIVPQCAVVPLLRVKYLASLL